MKIARIGVVVVVCLAWVFTARAVEMVSSDKLSDVMRQGKLVIAVDPKYPPVSELIQGAKRDAVTKCLSAQHTGTEFRGFDVDLAQEIARRLGVEACFVTPAWGEIISGRWAGRWDVSFNNISITTERMECLYFSQPYVSEATIFYIHKDNTTYHQPSDLSGKRIGVCSGCTYESYLEGTLRLPGEKIVCTVKNPIIIAYDVEGKLFPDFAVGDGVKIDAILTDLPISAQAIADGMPVKPLGEPVFYSYIAGAFDKKQSLNPIPFIQKINEIITEMHRDDTLVQLAKKYNRFAEDIITPARNFNMESLRQFPE